jgi:rare lipoprotein A
VFDGLALAAGVLGIGIFAFSAASLAKTPGSTYCFRDICHRVKTLAEVRAQIGKEETVRASFYDHCNVDAYNPCALTSSGEEFRPDRLDNAASPTYPDGTRVLVTNPANGRALILRINNAGPYYESRTLDVSRAAAEALGFSAVGVAVLRLRPLSVQ